MPWYSISYDLRKPFSFEAWERVGDALRTAFDWCTPLYGLWIVESDLSPSEIIGTLLNLKAIDENDGIVVLEITRRGDFRRIDRHDAVFWMRSHLERM